MTLYTESASGSDRTVKPADAQHMLIAANFYARKLGWSVFPLQAGQKNPYTTHGFKDATTESGTISHWWAGKPELNIGFATGAIVVLDFDSYKSDFAGGELLELLCEVYPTSRVRTGQGGQQLFYRQPPEWRLGNSSGSLPSRVDVRGFGGYVVLPPSRLKLDSGDGRYAWHSGAEPWNLPPAMLPQLVRDLIIAPREDARPAQASGIVSGASPNQNRNSVIAQFNAQTPITDLLIKHGYTLGKGGGGGARLARPGGDSLSIVVSRINGREKSYHHSTSDPLHTPNTSHARDAFDIFTMLEHGGDAQAAFTAAKKAQGTWQEGRHAGGGAASNDIVSPDRIDKLEPADVTDWGNAAYTRRRTDGVLYTPALSWLGWTGTHWSREIGETAAHLAVTSALRERCMRALAANDLPAMRATEPSAKHTRDTLFHYRHMVSVPSAEFDTVPHAINTLSGVVDLRNGDIVGHEPSNRFTYCIQSRYTPGERSQLWESLLVDWFGDAPDTILFLKRSLGYTITGENREECLFYIFGPGRSGKGTLVNSVANLLGAPLFQGIQFNAFTSSAGDAQNFRLAPLRNARMVSASESKRGDRLNEAMIKNVTGRDNIQAAHKYAAPFTFTPQFKLWLMSNDMPRGDVTDEAFWYRVKLITLNHSRMGGEDKGLKDALAAPAERDALLAWLVHGAMQWYGHGLETPAALLQNVRAVREAQDVISMWIEDCLQQGSTGSVVETDIAILWDSYADWCKRSGELSQMPRRALLDELRKRGFESKRTSRRVRGNPNPVIVWVVSGLALR